MIKPRDYQEKVISECIEFFNSEEKKSPSVYVAPVAAGKSIIIGSIASKLTTPTLVLQPSKELLEQNYSKLVKFGGEASIYSASMGLKEIGNITYATLGSIKKLGKEFKKRGVKNVLIDECHYGYSPKPDSMFRKFMKDLSPEKVIGVTATPVRLNTYGSMHESWSQLDFITDTRPSYFKEILGVVPISLMTKRGYWTDLEYETYDFDESILRLNSTGSEFTEASIKRSISEQGINKLIAKRVKHLLNTDYTNVLVFVDSVATAIKMSALFNNAAAVHAKTKKKDRTDIIEGFKNGDIKVVFNVGVLTTGFDHEQIDSIVLGRPTNSLALYYQMSGRGTRIHRDKENCLIIDFCNNIKRFGKLEDLKFQELPEVGWGIYNTDYLLTGIPMGAKVSLEEMKTKSEYILNSKEDYIMEFGKFRGTKLSKVPLAYRQWMLSTVDNITVHSISKAELKTQLLVLMDREADIEVKEDELILVDFNNISHKLYTARSLSSEGLTGLCTQLKNGFQVGNLKVISDATKDSYWRRQIYPDYKQNRKKVQLDEDFKKGLDDVYKNSELIIENKKEADDIIGEYVRDPKLKKVIVYSGDSDFKQLAVFSKFTQVNPKDNKIFKTTKKEAFTVLITKILKGDSKDNIKKCHNHARIMSNDLKQVIDDIYFSILKEVTEKKITDIEKLNLHSLIYDGLSNKFDLDREKYDLNFKLINLIQKQY